jgi:hypothetical protein
MTAARTAAAYPLLLALGALDATAYLRGEGLLPGFVEGYSKREPRAHRHGRETLRQLLPLVAESLRPPGGGNGSGKLLGVTEEAIREFALGGLTRRLRLIDVPLQTVFG